MCFTVPIKHLDIRVTAKPRTRERLGPPAALSVGEQKFIVRDQNEKQEAQDQKEATSKVRVTLSVRD